MLMNNPVDKGGLRLPAIYLGIVVFLGVLLAGCGQEGPLGNTPGPKKPVWQSGLGRLN
jgi:hypothetical protein